MVHMERNGSLFKTNVETMSTLQNLKVHLKKERSKIFKVFKKDCNRKNMNENKK